jgi:hypothetical protein
MLLKKIFWFWWREKKSDSEFLSYNIMLHSGKKFRALRDTKNKYLSSCPKVKWSVPKSMREQVIFLWDDDAIGFVSGPTRLDGFLWR